MNTLQATSAATYVGMQFGNYRVTRVIGWGGAANVLLCKHIYLERRVAIKILRQRTDEACKKLRMEANVLARLQHPHIVRAHEFGMQGTTPFLVMDYARYGNLRQQYPLYRPLPPIVVLRYVKQIASALQYMHNKGWIHQDVKPENMLVMQPGYLLLSDMGIALSASQAHMQAGRARAGTTTYCAPEQLRGIPCVASDQYALAIVAYEWLSGEPPFQGASLEVIRQHIYAAVPSLCARVPYLSPAVDRVLRKALAKEPALRFASVSDFVVALEVAIDKSRGRHYERVGRRSRQANAVFVSPYVTEQPQPALKLRAHARRKQNTRPRRILPALAWLLFALIVICLKVLSFVPAFSVWCLPILVLALLFLLGFLVFYHILQQ